MLKCKKGDTVCLIDYLRPGEILETTVISSGTKYIKVMYYPYLKFEADTLRNNSTGGGYLFIGSKQQYFSAKKHAQERAAIIERIRCKLTELSMIQLRDIEYQLKQMLS
jgi:hypothetical protein